MAGGLQSIRNSSLTRVTMTTYSHAYAQPPNTKSNAVNDICSPHGLIVIASLGYFQSASRDRRDYYEVPDC